MFRFAFPCAAALLTAGCTATGPVGLSDLGAATPQADATVAIAPVRYGSVVGSYIHRMPVQPNDWRKTGVEMAPVGPAAPEGGR
ncbi:hypothetical protein GCM10011390_03050 [Aureimonas endophytica]|uniref:Uncharacterized protein n=1 Tax=Aureimonas endophytica TaxID=2027858 RepID=A0A917E117_9HYPH|nr:MULTISPECIES: hypothetical protein [Aureimonas]GGD87721.1 hypothetical protein GCM10011390_03050 [Aureimonas endophytica]